MSIQRVLALSVVAASCALPTSLNAQSADSSTVASRAFTLAIGAADTASLVRLLDSTAVLIESDGSRVVGGRAVGYALLQSRFGPGTFATIYEPEGSVGCMDGGAVQNGVYSVRRVTAGGAVGMEAGSLALRWVVRDHGWQVDAIALVANAASRAATGKLSSQCGRPDLIQFTRRRIELSLMPVSIATWGALGQLESSLAANGWDRAAAIDDFRNEYQVDNADLNDRGRLNPGMLWLAAAAVRVASHARIMATIQPIASEARLVSYNVAASSRLTEAVNLREGAVELVGDWNGLRAGIGPTVVTSTVAERYEDLVLHDPTSPTGAPARASVENESYSPTSIGGVGSLEYTRPISNRLAASVIARSRVAPALAVPGVQTHRDWSYGVNGSYLGLFVSTGW